MKSPTANRTGETSRNNDNSRISQMERNLQLKSVRSWCLIRAKNGDLLPVENTYLAHTHAARWSPSADESAEEEQMSAINTHNQSLSDTQALISHFFVQEGGTAVLLGNQSYNTASPSRGQESAGVWAQPTENRLPHPGLAVPGGVRHEGTEHGHTIWSQVVEPPMSGVWEGILSWQRANRAALPRAGISRCTRAQHVWLQPLGLWVALRWCCVG